jgi:hypothetical protein
MADELAPRGPTPPGPPVPVPVRVTNAFSVGFWAFWGAFMASLLVWVLVLIAFAACGSLLSGLRPT